MSTSQESNEKMINLILERLEIIEQKLDTRLADYVPRIELEIHLRNLEREIANAKKQSTRESKDLSTRIDEFEKNQRAFVTKLVTGLSVLMTAIGAYLGSLV